MIEFMVIAEPRSGTTWASVWLTTDATLCLHDPLAVYHYSEWDALPGTKTMGVSDTGISAYWEWLNAHPARKVVLHRDRREIADSLGIEEIMTLPCYLDKVKGMHVHWTDLFNAPKLIYEYLLRREFDAERHAVLRGVYMQPSRESIQLDRDLVRRLANEAKEACRV